MKTLKATKVFIKYKGDTIAITKACMDAYINLKCDMRKYEDLGVIQFDFDDGSYLTVLAGGVAMGRRERPVTSVKDGR